MPPAGRSELDELQEEVLRRAREEEQQRRQEKEREAALGFNPRPSKYLDLDQLQIQGMYTHTHTHRASCERFNATLQCTQLYSRKHFNPPGGVIVVAVWRMFICCSM